MKKIISLILSLIFISSLVFTVSCAQQEEEIFDQNFHVEYEIDMTGQHFVWGSTWDQEICPSADFSIVGDKIHKRFRDLKEKYGCTIEVINWEDGSGRSLQEVAAGRHTIDLIDSHADAGGIQLYKAGLLYALEDITNVDWNNEKFGVPRFLQYGIFDGKQYGFYHYAWEFPPEYHGVLMFNTDMLRSFGVQIPHEFKEAGNWNWATFKDYLISIEEAERNNGDDSNFYPYISGDSYAADAIGYMFANGCKMIEKDAGGNYVFGFDNGAGMEAVDFLADLFKSGLYVQKGATTFSVDQQSALMSHETYWATHYYEKSSSQNYLPAQEYAYGLISFPHGPHGDANSVSGYVHHHRRLNWILNQSANSPDEIGLVLDFVFEPLDDSNGWRDFLKDQIFYTTEDHENYVYMLENVNFSYGTIYLDKGFSTFTSGLNSAVAGRKSVSEVFSSAKTAIDEAIRENVTWIYEDLISE